MINHLSLQGRLVDAPSCGTTNSGTEYANFRIAWNEKIKDKEAKLFLDCKAFSGTATFIGKWFGKGQEIIVEGKLNTEEWTSQDGQKRSKIALIVSNAHFCGRKQDADAGPEVNMTPVEMKDGELPF